MELILRKLACTLLIAGMCSLASFAEMIDLLTLKDTVGNKFEIFVLQGQLCVQIKSDGSRILCPDIGKKNLQGIVNGCLKAQAAKKTLKENQAITVWSRKFKYFQTMDIQVIREGTRKRVTLLIAHDPDKTDTRFFLSDGDIPRIQEVVNSIQEQHSK